MGPKTFGLLAYGVVAGLAAAVFWWFAGLLSEHVESIGLAILVSCIAVCAFVLVNVTARWILNLRVQKGKLSTHELLDELMKQVDPTSDKPMSTNEKRLLLFGLLGFVRSLIPYLMAIFIAGTLISVAVLVVGLVNAGVMYLQNERLKQQNNVISAQFLNETSESIEVLNNQILVTRGAALALGEYLDSFSNLFDEAEETEIFVLDLEDRRVLVCDSSQNRRCDEQLMVGFDGFVTISEDQENTNRSAFGEDDTAMIGVLEIIAIIAHIFDHANLSSDISNDSGKLLNISGFTDALSTPFHKCGIEYSDRILEARNSLNLLLISLDTLKKSEFFPNALTNRLEVSHWETKLFVSRRPISDSRYALFEARELNSLYLDVVNRISNIGPVTV